LLLNIESFRQGDHIFIRAEGPLTNQTADVLHREVIRALGANGARQLTLELEDVPQLDTAGAAVLVHAAREARRVDIDLAVTGLASDHLRLLDLVDPGTILDDAAGPRRKTLPFVEKIGANATFIAKDTLAFFTFTGEFTVEVARSILHPARIRLAEVGFYMERAGFDAIPIVFLISLLLGLILGFQAAIQLKQFGANIYVADLVGVAITRELGPLLTAIIVAGRSGSSFAAEIGTMMVSEEVAALETMGLNRTRFLVMPKVLALIIMLPCLALCADVLGILGGLIVGVFQLDLTVNHYIAQTRLALSLTDIVTGLFKSAVFALLIAGIGCFRGLQVTNDAESVGRCTTSAVVSAIFLIIATDAAFTVIFYAVGI